jgi:2,3-bisphosphoglycerate-dependent phosphoglycerate mutase
VKRTIPYLTEVILPKAVNENKRILITSSENAIRGMLMKLCDVPKEMVSELSIPNGVPMIYNENLKLWARGPVSLSRGRTRRSCGRTL